MNLNEKFLTLSEVAGLLHLSSGYCTQIWPSWIKYNVNPIKSNGNGRLLFKKSEILQMVENWTVIKK